MNLSTPVIITDDKTKFSAPRVWELDFLRGISIILMCIDHFFNDVYYMFWEWQVSSSSFLKGLYNVASFYYGRHPKSIILPEDKMHYAEYVFLLFILLVITLVFVKNLLQKKKDISKKEVTDYVSGSVLISVCVISTFIIHKTIGYHLLEGHSLRDFIHPIIITIFFILCGQGCCFSKSNVKRTFLIALCAAAVSIATILAEKLFGLEGVAVRYGVLHVLATCVLIFTVIQGLCTALIKDKEKRKYVISIICIVLGVAVYAVGQYLWVAPDVPKNDALAWFHYVFASSFASSDWFTLSENLHLVLFGAAIAPFVYVKKRSFIPCLTPLNKGVVCFMGRNTLWVVLFHQIIIFVLLTLINAFLA